MGLPPEMHESIQFYPIEIMRDYRTVRYDLAVGLEGMLDSLDFRGA
jgi:hypothetical protein